MPAAHHESDAGLRGREFFREIFSFHTKTRGNAGKKTYISVTRRTPGICFRCPPRVPIPRSTVLGISFREKLSSASKKLREAAEDARGKTAPLREKLSSLHVKGIHKENAGAADAGAEQGTAETKSTSGRFHMPRFPFTGRKSGEPENPETAQSAAPGAGPEEKAATQSEAGAGQEDKEITGRMKWVANPLKSGWDALSDKMPPKEKVEEKMGRAGSFLKKQAGILAGNLPRKEDFSEAFSRAGEKAREGFRAVSGKILSAGVKDGEAQDGPTIRERVDELRDILHIKRKESRPEEKDVPGTPGASAGRAAQDTVHNAGKGAAPEGEHPTAEQQEAELGRLKWVANPLKYGWQAVTKNIPHGEGVSAAAQKAGQLLKEGASSVSAAAERIRENKKVAAACRTIAEKAREGLSNVEDRIPLLKKFQEKKQDKQSSGPSAEDIWLLGKPEAASSPAKEETAASGQSAGNDVIEADELLITDQPGNNASADKAQVQAAAETAAEAAPSESAQPEEETAAPQAAAETVAEAAPSESVQPEEETDSTQAAAETVAEAAPSESVQPEEEAAVPQETAETVAETEPSESAQPEEETAAPQETAETVAENAPSESAQEAAAGQQAAEAAPEEKPEASGSEQEAAPGFFGRLKNRVSSRAKHLKPVREVVGYTAGKAGSIVKEELGAVADKLPDREAVTGAMKGAIRDAGEKLSSAAEGLKKKAGEAADINFAGKAREGAGFLRGRFRSLREKIHPVEEIRKSAEAAGNKIKNAAGRAEENIREAAERIPSGETARKNVRGVLGRMGSLQEKFSRKPADPYQSGNRGVQAIGRLARGISHGVADLADMSHALGSMAANGLTNKAALPALEELMNQTFRHYGKVRSIEFRDGTLALGMKISGIREIVPVSIGTVIMSPDGKTLSFSDFASTVPAVARGLELLAVENGPVSIDDGKTAAVLRSARWLGLINTQKGRK